MILTYMRSAFAMHLKSSRGRGARGASSQIVLYEHIVFKTRLLWKA